MRCDAVRVATLVIGSSGDTTRYTWAGVDDDFHEVAHDNVAGAYDKFLAINSWHGAQFASLLTQLDAVQEANGTTLLDNTIVMWTNELGMGNFTHNRFDVPIVLAGGQGILDTGRFLDLGGAHYHQLLFTLAVVLRQLVESPHDIRPQTGHEARAGRALFTDDGGQSGQMVKVPDGIDRDTGEQGFGQPAGHESGNTACARYAKE